MGDIFDDVRRRKSRAVAGASDGQPVHVNLKLQLDRGRLYGSCFRLRNGRHLRNRSRVNRERRRKKTADLYEQTGR